MYITTKFLILLYNAVQYSKVWYSTIIWYATVQYSTLYLRGHIYYVLYIL